MLPEKLKDLSPRIHRLRRPVARGMVIPEPVPRTIVAIEFIVLPASLKFSLVLVYLLW